MSYIVRWYRRGREKRSLHDHPLGKKNKSTFYPSTNVFVCVCANTWIDRLMIDRWKDGCIDRQTF